MDKGVQVSESLVSSTEKCSISSPVFPKGHVMAYSPEQKSSAHRGSAVKEAGNRPLTPLTSSWDLTVNTSILKALRSPAVKKPSISQAPLPTIVQEPKDSLQMGPRSLDPTVNSFSFS